MNFDVTLAENKTDIEIDHDTFGTIFVSTVSKKLNRIRRAGRTILVEL